MKQDIANILSMLCKRKGVEIVEAEICPDHVHMLVKIPPSLSVSSFVGYLKGKSTLMIFERHANLKYKYGNRHFWCRGYYVDTVGKNAKKIQEYIQNQLQNYRQLIGIIIVGNACISVDMLQEIAEVVLIQPAELKAA